MPEYDDNTKYLMGGQLLFVNVLAYFQTRLLLDEIGLWQQFSLVIYPGYSTHKI